MGLSRQFVLAILSLSFRRDFPAGTVSHAPSSSFVVSFVDVFSLSSAVLPGLATGADLGAGGGAIFAALDGLVVDVEVLDEATAEDEDAFGKSLVGGGDGDFLLLLATLVLT